MFDAHCHVTDIEEPIRVLHAARRAGVTSLLCCGYNEESNRAVVQLRRRVAGLPIALGLHPWFATQALGTVEELIEQEQPLAIGECGLDGYELDPEIPPLTVQLPVFEAQLDLAERLGLPVTVHSRKAVNEVVTVASRFKQLRGVLHAYSGSWEQVRPLLDQGWMIGIGGAVTRPRAKRIRHVAASIPIDQVLLETDAPAIGLEGVWPPMVRPHHVVEVARALADLRAVALEELVSRTNDNARRMFGAAAFTTWDVPQCPESDLPAAMQR